MANYILYCKKCKSKRIPVYVGYKNMEEKPLLYKNKKHVYICLKCNELTFYKSLSGGYGEDFERVSIILKNKI